MFYAEKPSGRLVRKRSQGLTKTVGGNERKDVKRRTKEGKGERVSAEGKALYEVKEKATCCVKTRLSCVGD